MSTDTNHPYLRNSKSRGQNADVSASLKELFNGLTAAAIERNGQLFVSHCLPRQELNKLMRLISDDSTFSIEVESVGRFPCLTRCSALLLFVALKARQLRKHQSTSSFVMMSLIMNKVFTKLLDGGVILERMVKRVATQNGRSLLTSADNLTTVRRYLTGLERRLDEKPDDLQWQISFLINELLRFVNTEDDENNELIWDSIADAMALIAMSQ